MGIEGFIFVWQSDHYKIVPYTKAFICFYNIGNPTRNYQTDGENDIQIFVERSR